MRISRWLFFAVFFFVAAFAPGCGASGSDKLSAPERMQNDPGIAVNEDELALVIPTRSGTTTAESVITPTPNSIPSATPTLVAPAAFKVTQKCVRLLESPPEDFSDQGSIFLLDYHFLEPTLRFDLSTRQITSFPYSTKGYSQVSLDRKWIAYQGEQAGEKKIFIADSSGVISTSLPWEENWRLIVGWVDGNRLLISKKISPPDFITGTDETVVVNPFTGERIEMPLPKDIHADATGNDTWGGYTWTFSVYDPQLNLVLYPGWARPSNVSHLILRNMLTGQKVRDVRIESRFAPKWLEDSSGVIFAGTMTRLPEETTPIQDEIFIMDRTGEITQLTAYASLYQDQEITIFDSALSPNGNSVAFWVDYLPSASRSNSLPGQGSMGLGSLSILDLQTGEVVDLCVPSSGVYYSTPVWSPDNRYIMTSIAQHTPSGETYQGSVYIIDVEKSVIFAIADNLLEVGWMGLPQR